MISENAKCWIWITHALGCANKKVKSLFELYDDISEFTQGGIKEWRHCGLFTEAELNRLEKTDFSKVNKTVADCGYFGYSAVSISDPEYPDALRHIYNPPAVLYVNGRLPELEDRLSIGIVGTRTASKYGTDNAFRFGYSLAKYGVCVISGGALGVDCAAHRGVLAAKGETVCVLGCGIDYKYLRENEGMRKAIAQNGAVISEYPPGTPPRAYHFPERNRIIAALSNGVLIIESGERSGSLITADFALEFGKELFALVGNNSPLNKGSNGRIKEGTAIPVTDFMDILTEFEEMYAPAADAELDGISFADIEKIPVKRKKQGDTKLKENSVKEIKAPKERAKEAPSAKTEHKKDLNLTGDEKRVYEFVSSQPVHIDNIAEGLELSVHKTLSLLTMLEVRGLVRAHPGRRYSLAE